MLDFSSSSSFGLSHQVSRTPLLLLFYPVSSYGASVSSFNPSCTSRSFSPASFGNSSVSTSWSCCCFPSSFCPSSVLLLSLFYIFSIICPFHPFFNPPLAFFLSRHPLNTLSDWLAELVSTLGALPQPLSPSPSLSFTLFGDMEERHIPKLSLSEGIRFQGHPPPLPYGFPPVLISSTHTPRLDCPPLPSLLLSHVFHHSDSNNMMQNLASVGKPETVSNPFKNSSCFCWSELLINATGWGKQSDAKNPK